MNYQIIILAAGHGTRMESEIPKILHKVGNIPMINRVLSTAAKVTDDIILVYASSLKNELDSYKKMYNGLKVVLQEEALGTGDAVKSALDMVGEDKIIVVLYADNPLITSDIISQLLIYLEKEKLAVVTLAFNPKNTSTYGRIITDELGNFLKIVEFVDANEEERNITLCNAGIMAFNASILHKYLNKIENTNKKGEFYLTDMIQICKNHDEKVSYYQSPNSDRLLIGVNTQAELKEANAILINDNIE